MVDYFSIGTPDYPIRCKRFLPDSADVRCVILGVHGFAGDKESGALVLLAEKTAPFGACLVCFDFPAHGDSPADESALTVKNCMRDLLTVAAHCRGAYPDADKCLFATSFGGFVTLLCSGELTDFRVVLRAPAVTMPELLPGVLGVTPEEFREKGAVECGFERKMTLPYSFYDELRRFDVFDRAYSEPMLILHGDADDVVPPADVRRFCAAHPGMRLQTIHGADHRFKKPGELEAVARYATDFWGMRCGADGRIDRIRAMEEAFDASRSAVRALSDALDGMEQACQTLDRLTEYYESPLWREDFEADEAGLLPPGLKRGVLSEDGVWDLLTEWRELKKRMRLLIEDSADAKKTLEKY